MRSISREVRTTLEGMLETVCLRFSEYRFPYVTTKNCTIINREQIAKIQEFWADAEVLEPDDLGQKNSRDTAQCLGFV
jgi:hypothetical protein